MPSNGTAQRGTRMVNSNGKGRICLVTGSGARTGLGYAMVDAFAREGAKVVVSDIAAKQKEGQAIVDEINSKWGAGNAIWVAIDVTKEEDWKAGIEKIEAEFGPLDVCCNNAGIATQTDMKTESLGDLNLADYDRMMDINVRGVVLGSKYAAQSMAKNHVEEWKSIINTSSVAGLQAGGLPSYSTSKWAVRGWTKNAAILGAKDKIRVNSIHPGAIKSEMTQSLDWLDQNFEADGTGKHLAAQHMLGRFGVPAEVANVVLLLAGNEGSFLTGQEWVVDGGLHRS